MNFKFYWLQRAAALLTWGIQAVAFVEDDARLNVSVSELLAEANAASDSHQMYWLGFRTRKSAPVS